MDEQPSVGDRLVTIRVAGVEVGYDYEGPFYVKEWDGTKWQEIGRAETKDDLRAMGCNPPDLKSVPRYANRRTR